MADTRRVFVTNIPVRTCIDGFVTIPSDTPEDKLNEAITDALKAGAWSNEAMPSFPDHDIDYSLIDGWDFDIAEDDHGS